MMVDDEDVKLVGLYLYFAMNWGLSQSMHWEMLWASQYKATRVLNSACVGNHELVLRYHWNTYRDTDSYLPASIIG